MNIPVCCVTGRIAGDSDACGDCDPCGAAHTVPDVVKRLLTEKEEWRQRYAAAMEDRGALEPHAYAPSVMHMGDCAICGHLQGDAIHSPFRRS